MQAAAASAAATATGLWAFKYNRTNYLWDSVLRFNRYVTGYQFAIAQAQQYRDDIRDFTELTVSKQETYTILGCVFMILNIMLMLSGRLGVFGPAPPGWIMGIYWGNVTSALCFLLTMVWLSVHATGRAMSGGANMLTRHVRLPVPTPKQLDKARKTANTWEQQRVADTFRVPFIAPAPKAPEGVFVDLELGAAGTGKAERLPAAPARRMPKWYQDELHELHGNPIGPSPGRHATPLHFELYRGLQQEWWAHEAYVRIALLCFMTHWLTAVNLYTQCHCFTELRALWPAWAITPLFCTINWIILKIDIIPENRTRLQKLPMEHIHPWMPIITNFAMSWEYSAVRSGGGWIALIYVLSWICYASQFFWIVKLYDLTEPTEQGEHPDVAGRAWWPEDWLMPPAFNGSLYLVAPPRVLDKAVPHCLLIEMKAARGEKGGKSPIMKQRRCMTPQLFPWMIFRGAMLTAIVMWLFIICARIFDECHGERGLLKQEGREVRFPSPMQGFVTPWTRSGQRSEMAHAGGSDRRLEEEREEEEEEVASTAQDLIDELTYIVDKLIERQRTSQISASFAAFSSLLRGEGADADTWPKGFLPSFLASRAGRIVALAKDRQGMILSLPGDEDSATAFHVSGIDHLGLLLGAWWGEDGLLLSTAAGVIAECRGSPGEDGLWPCRALGPALPGSAHLGSIAAARVPGRAATRAALSFADAVTIFEAEDEGEWFPIGEVRLPGGSGSDLALEGTHLSFTQADELLISLHDGSSMRWRLTEAEPVLLLASQPPGAVWHGSCRLGDGRMLHLATSTGNARPDLLLSSRS